MQLDRTLPAQIVVDYTLGGTATLGTDYKLQYNNTDLNGSVTIPANTASVKLDIVPIDEDTYDPDETIEFALKDGVLYNLDTVNSQTINVNDNEPVASITAVDNFPENDSLTNVFTLTLDKPAPQTLTVPYTVTGTAAPGNDKDYEPLGGQVTFAAGESSKTIPVKAIDDATQEDGETIILTLNDSSSKYVIDGTKKVAQALLIDGTKVEEKSPSDDYIRIKRPPNISRTFVAEGTNQPAQLQINLVQKPTADVKISFNTSDQLEPIPDVTIPLANWSKLVTVDVYAKSDTKVEPEDVTVDLGFTLTSGDSRFNNLAVPARPVVVRDLELDGNELSDGLDKLLQKVEQLLAQQLDSSDLPLIGSLGQHTPNFIASFRKLVVSKIKDGSTTTLTNIAKTIEEAIVTGLKAIGHTPEVEVKINAGLEETTFDISIGTEVSKDTSLSADVGVPSLGLKLDGKGIANFDYQLGLSFGWHKDFGLFVDTDKTGIKVGASVGLAKDFKALGNLGFLQVEAKNNPADSTNVSMDFVAHLQDLDLIPTIRYLDVNNNNSWDPDEPNVAQEPNGTYPILPVVGRFDTNGNGEYDADEGELKINSAQDDGERFRLSELDRNFTQDDLNNLFVYELTGAANLGMKLVTSVGGSTKFPSFLVDLNIDWDAFTHTGGEEEFKGPVIAFDNMQLDVGSFAANFGKPIFEQINKVVKPMRPFIDFLKQDISLFSSLGLNSLFGKPLDGDGDGKKSLVEFISVLPGSKTTVLNHINALDQAIKFADLLDKIANTSGNYKLDLGSYTIVMNDDPIKSGYSKPNMDGLSGLRNFTFSVPEFSLEKFSTGLKDLFVDDKVDDQMDLSWPAKLSLRDFTGGLRQLFSFSGLRADLNLDWSTLSLEDFATKFSTPGGDKLSLSSTLGSSGIPLREFALGLKAMFAGPLPNITLDWSKLSLQEFAIGLKGMMSLSSSARYNLNLGDISLQKFSNLFEPLFSDGAFSQGSLSDIKQPDVVTKLQSAAITEQLRKQSNGDNDELDPELEDALKELDREMVAAQQNKTLEFPILTDPMVAVNLLLGKPANLFTYDLPPLELEASFDASFPIYPGPPTISLGFGGHAKIGADLAFGFDTKGMIDWSKQNFALNKAYLPLDGFYLSDRENPDGTGLDVPEITAELGAYLELAGGLNIGVASLEAYARGGLLGTLGLNFRDTGESNGTSDGKIRALSEIGANITQPWQLFNLQGALSATAQIGIRAQVAGVFKQDLYKKDFGPYTLATFEYGPNGFTVATVFDGPVAGATVFFDANFNNIHDPDEPHTLSKIDGSYELAIPLELYDSDGNGKIELSEGQIVLKDGADTDTYQDQRIPFISSPEWKVASPLTMLAMKVEKADPAKVEAQIEKAFGLPAKFKLYEELPLPGLLAGDSAAAAVFRMQVQLQNLLILGSNTLGKEGDRSSGATALINETVKRIQAGEAIDLTKREQLQSLVENAATALGVTPTDLEMALDELEYLNQEIAKVGGTGEAARAAIVKFIPYDIADGSYLTLLENPWVSLLRAAVPEPDTEKAQQVVRDAFGLGGVNISSFNPIEQIAKGNTMGLEVYAKQVQINATLTQLADIIIGFNVQNAETVVSDALANLVKKGDTFTNMGDAAKIQALLAEVAPTLPKALVDGLAGIIAQSNAKINDLLAQAGSGNLEDLRLKIADEQRLAQGIQSQLLQSVALGEITFDQFQTLLEFNKNLDMGIIIERIIDGTEGDDTLVGDTRNELFTALGGNDLIQTGGGDNIAYANQGRDTLEGGEGIDVLAAGRDDDLIRTGDGYNYAFGNKGNDRIEGGANVDYIYGGQENDAMFGHAGDDWVLGEKGDDFADGGDGYDIIVGGEGADSLLGGGGDDAIFGNLANDSIDGGLGNDTISAGKEDDWVAGNAGEDVLYGNIGLDTLDGGEGNDTLAAGQDNDWVFGNVGDDQLFGNLGNDVLDGGEGNDSVLGGQEDDGLFGSSGDDVLFGNLGNDVLNGGDGNDYLAGGQNNDSLLGGLGDDTLSGDLGDDSLTGGAGIDRFMFAANGGNDVIADFTDGVDLIALSAEFLTEIQTRQTIAVNTEQGARIELGSGSLTLPGIDAAAIGVNDFVSSI